MRALVNPVLSLVRRMDALRRASRALPQSERNIRLFCADTAIQGVIMGGISSYISVFIVRLGASNLLVSLLTSLPAVVGATLYVPLGLYVERQHDMIRLTNQYRLVHRGGFLLIALAPFLFSAHLPAVVVALWALGAVPGALINLSWTAAVAEMVPPQRRPSVNGFRWALVSLVTAVSVAGFGYLLEHTPYPVGYQIVFATSFVGGLLSMYFWSRIKLPAAEPSAAPARPQETTRGSTLTQRLKAYFAPIAQESAFVRFLLTTFVLRFGLNLPTALYSIYWIRNLNASDLWIGWRGTASSLALVVGYFAWGRIAGRKGHHPVLLACTLGLGLYPVLTALVRTQTLLPLVALVFGFFVTGIDLAFFDTLLHICPPKKRASFVAVNLVFADLAIFVAPMAGSLLTRWVDIRTLFYVAGAFHVLALLLFWLFRIGVE